MAGLVEPSTLRCLTDGTKAEVKEAEPATTTTIRVRPLTVPHAGDAAAGVVMTTRIIDDYGVARYRNQFEFVRIGRVIVDIHANTDTTVDFTKLRERLARTLARRVRTALGNTVV